MPLEVVAVESTAENARLVAVVLPGAVYSPRIQPNPEFTYLLLRDRSFSMFAPFAFDCDAYVEEAMAYCRSRNVEGVFGFDCLPSLLASIINQSLNLAGPSFQSVFLCINKYYMRKVITPEVPVTPFDLRDLPAAPREFPVVVKCTDCQFCVGVRILHNEQEWDNYMAKLSAMPVEQYDRRQQFHHKWLHKLGADPVLQEQRWQDLVLWHIEPFYAGREHQIEVVIENGTPLVADTGDIIKQDGIITLFVTPGSIVDFPTEFTKSVTMKLHDFGYDNQAIDIEFILSQDGPQLVEVNSRYSYMGWASYRIEMLKDADMDQDGSISESSDANCDGILDAREQGEGKQFLASDKMDLRNLKNRTLACLGAEVPKMPSETNQLSKLAMMVYTNQAGPVDDILDQQFLKSYVASGTVEAWVGKATYNCGRVTEDDLAEYSGWAKLGFLILTARRIDTQATNEKLAYFLKNLFRGREGTYLLAQDPDMGCEVDKYSLIKQPS